MADANVIVITTPEATIVKIMGEMRLKVEDVERHLDTVMLSRPALLVIDLSELTFMSSLGMGIMHTLNRTVARHGGKVVLAGVQENVEQSFRFTRLTDLIKAYPTVEAAIAAQGG